MPPKIKYLTLTLAVICYSVFSVSAPEKYKLTELIIAICLTVFAIFNIKGTILFIFKKENKQELILFISAILLSAGLLIIGILNNHSCFDILRDLIPFFYLFFPILVFSLINENQIIWRKLIISLLVFSAIIMTVRYWSYPESIITELGRNYLPFGKGQFVFEPCTIFSSTLLLTLPIINTTGLKRNYDIALRILMFTGGLFILTLAVATIMRAQVILTILSFSIVVIFKISTLEGRARNISTLVLLISILLILLIFSKEIIYFAKIIILKFQYAGLNGKGEEAISVINQAVSDPVTLIFGKGWGATFLNPATGSSVYTRYTHNIFTYFLLKGGIIGVLLLGIYVVWIIRLLIKVFRKKDLPVFLAVSNTLIIHFMLEGGYKLFSIGLIISILYAYNKEKCCNHTFASTRLGLVVCGHSATILSPLRGFLKSTIGTTVW